MTRIALALGLLALAGCMTGPVPIHPGGAAPSSEVNPITGSRGNGGAM